MQPHDALYHYGVKGMRWGIRSRSKVYDQPERKAAAQNAKDFHSGKIGDKEYARKEASIRKSIRAKERAAVQREKRGIEKTRAAKEQAKIDKIRAMPNSQAKADKIVGLNTKNKGLFSTREAAVKSRLDALSKAGFDKGQAKRGLRSYENAMYGVSAGLLATSVTSAVLIAKGKQGAGLLDYAIAAGAGAAVGRGVARVVSDRKGEGTPFKPTPKMRRPRKVGSSMSDQAFALGRGA